MNSPPAPRPHHPGRGGKGRRFDRGRQVTPQARRDIADLLGDRARRRDLLIEYLHLVQDRYGGLSREHLAALAETMRLPQAEIYEVATFYAHFDVGTPFAGITIRICDSITCAGAGIEPLLAAVPPGARVLRAPCMGRCDCAPAAMVGHRAIDHATPERIAAAAHNGATEPVIPDYSGLVAARQSGAYALLQACQNGERPREQVIAEVETAGLRGLGGAGFPAARKWRFVAAEPKPRLMAVNADEGEPGTFKDRWILETDPHRFLEGALIAAWIVEAEDIYIYLRDEYPAAREILLCELAALRRSGLPLPARLHLRRGAGAYICGEESALLESLEGKRGLPRHRPPFPAQVGLFGRPTLIHNVETLYWLPEILARGGDRFAERGAPGHKGVRAFSVSGRVRIPGVKIAPAGTTARELIDEYCGGMAPGHRFTAYLPGGASGGLLPASLADLPLDFGALDEYGCFVGSGAVVILSQHDPVREVVRNLMHFFEDESCGQCTPCRVGTEKALALMQAETWDRPLLHELCDAMADASICGLGQAAPNPLRCAMHHFPAEFEP